MTGHVDQPAGDVPAPPADPEPGPAVPSLAAPDQVDETSVPLPASRAAAARARAGRRASLAAELLDATQSSPTQAPAAADGSGIELYGTPQPIPEATPAPGPTWALAPVVADVEVDAAAPGAISDPPPALPQSPPVPVAADPTPVALPAATGAVAPPDTPPSRVFRLEPGGLGDGVDGDGTPPTSPAGEAAQGAAPVPAALGRPGAEAAIARRRRRSQPTPMPPRPLEPFEVAEDARGRVSYIDPSVPGAGAPAVVPAERSPLVATTRSRAQQLLTGWIAVGVLSVLMLIIFLIGMRLTA